MVLKIVSLMRFLMVTAKDELSDYNNGSLSPDFKRTLVISELNNSVVRDYPLEITQDTGGIITNMMFMYCMKEFMDEDDIEVFGRSVFYDTESKLFVHEKLMFNDDGKIPLCVLVDTKKAFQYKEVLKVKGRDNFFIDSLMDDLANIGSKIVDLPVVYKEWK